MTYKALINMGPENLFDQLDLRLSGMSAIGRGGTESEAQKINGVSYMLGRQIMTKSGKQVGNKRVFTKNRPFRKTSIVLSNTEEGNTLRITNSRLFKNDYVLLKQSGEAALVTLESSSEDHQHTASNLLGLKKAKQLFSRLAELQS